ncbi:MAG: hypothetical protein ACLFR1_12040 [Spirochaetia bacterium]
MKKFLILSLITFLALGAFMSCDQPPKPEDVELAAMIAWSTTFTVGLDSINETPAYEGYEYDETTDEMAFDSFDLTQLDWDESSYELAYDTMSGTVTTGEETWDCNVSFTGNGPIESLVCDTKVDLTNDSISITNITANGFPVEDITTSLE